MFSFDNSKYEEQKLKFSNYEIIKYSKYLRLKDKSEKK